MIFRTTALVLLGASLSLSVSAASSLTGDDDAAGRSVNFLGLLSNSLNLADKCPSSNGCVQLNAAPAPTSFYSPAQDKILIPGGSAHSLFCHWQTPVTSYRFENLTGSFQPNAQFSYSAVYTFVNKVLDDPTLVNPDTGLPFGGTLTVSVLSTYHTRSIQAGEYETERDTGTRVCIAGLISRNMLINGYGLSDSEADKFFQVDTEVSMAIQGNAQMVGSSVINIGTRLVGD
jgi:hypothetical protein